MAAVDSQFVSVQMVNRDVKAHKMSCLYINTSHVAYFSFPITPLKPSGYYTYHQVKHSEILPSVRTVYLCVLCGSQNKQRFGLCLLCGTD